jgi:hypothetical protein
MKKALRKIFVGIVFVCPMVLTTIYFPNNTASVYAVDNRLSQDVQRVKYYRFSNEYTKGDCEEELNMMVGMSGQIAWKSFGLIKGSGHIAEVRVFILRKMKDGSSRRVDIRYLLNRITGLVQLEKIIINEKELNQNEIFIELFEMKMDQS